MSGSWILSRAVLAKNVAPVKSAMGNIQKRNNFMFTPPTKRIPFGEKVVMGLVLTVSIMAIPTWVMFHVPDYQNERKSKEE